MTAGDAAAVARVRKASTPLDAKAAAALAAPDEAAAAAPARTTVDEEIDIEIDTGLERTVATSGEADEERAAEDFSGSEIDTSGISADGELTSDDAAAAPAPSPASLEDPSASRQFRVGR